MVISFSDNKKSTAGNYGGAGINGGGGSSAPHVCVTVEESASGNSGRREVIPSESLWKMASRLDDQYSWESSSCARLVWQDLTVKVVNQKGEAQTVLHSLTGYAEPGRFMTIMGPSGSGKSTLLDTLAGRLTTNATQTGMVLLNGRRKKVSYGTAAYVTQEDNLIGTLTVRESIKYSVDLRLSGEMGREQKAAIVEEVMVEMGLQECADTPVGNWHLRGISGGEKRRVSIAIEIITRPHLLFLDEPTSGLDSASAFFVIQTIHNLARDGRTVIASIHQPSSEVFDLFDDLVLLSSGRTVFFGHASNAWNFFESAGFPCPPLKNPSDHFLRCINSDFDTHLKVATSLVKDPHLQMKGEHKPFDPLHNLTTAHVIEVLLQAYQTSEYAIQATAKVHKFSQIKGDIPDSSDSQGNFWMQTSALTRRSFTNMWRDVGYYWLRLMIYALLSLSVGTIFIKVGTSYNAIAARTACGSFIFGFITFMSIGGFPSFVEDMKVFQKERSNGHYGVLVFVMANFLSSIPFLLFLSITSSSICYFIVELHPGFDHFMFFTLTLYASVMVVEGLMMVIASLVPNYLMGIITGAGIQGIFMLVAGYYRLPKDIPKPVWRYPVSYLSFYYWSTQGQFKNDLLGLEFDNVPSTFPTKLSGEQILEQHYQIDTRINKWVDLAVLFGMVLIYRLLFLGTIKIKESLIPWVRSQLARHSLQANTSSIMHLTS